jgi:hypothetical protein
MRRRWGVTCLVAALTAGCAAAPSPPSLRAAPATYLLGIDQLISPDFVLDVAPHPLAAAAIAAADGPDASRLAAAGFTGAAAEDFFRESAVLAVLDGPAQIGDTVEAFASSSGAATVYGNDIARRDAVAGTTQVSTGALGDAAHATTRTAVAPDGTSVVEITVEWRLANLVDILVLRGRAGGLRPDDALLLAHRQTAGELGLSTPVPASPSNPAASP